jgi:hypothetical protein
MLRSLLAAAFSLGSAYAYGASSPATDAHWESYLSVWANNGTATLQAVEECEPSDILRPRDGARRNLSRQDAFDPAVADPHLPSRARDGGVLVQRGQRQVRGHSADGFSIGKPGPSDRRAWRNHRFAGARQTSRPDGNRTGKRGSAAQIELQARSQRVAPEGQLAVLDLSIVPAPDFLSEKRPGSPTCSRKFKRIGWPTK